MMVPSLPCSAPGSTRASTAVLSQIEPTPGADIAAQALPEEFSGGAFGEIFWRNTSPLVVTGAGLTTVMSAPILVSQNGAIDCLTETEEAPLPLALDDHDASSLLAPLAAARAFTEGRFNMEASILSWLQSSLSMSTSLRISSSFFSGAGAASSSASSASSAAGGDCASAVAAAMQRPAASTSGRHFPINVLNFITPPGSRRT